MQKIRSLYCQYQTKLDKGNYLRAIKKQKTLINPEKKVLMITMRPDSGIEPWIEW